MRISKEDIERARQPDLLTYLQTYEPGELVRVGRGTYTTKTHDSLRISNGKWNWFSRKIGGVSALDYLIKVRGMMFIDAVKQIIGNVEIKPPEYRREYLESEREPFRMPNVADNIEKVKKYLARRGISAEIADYCHYRGLLYQTVNKGYANALFVGYDSDGHPRYGALRGLGGNFKGEVKGSDKRYAFCMNERIKPRHIHLFESAIDALSFAELDRLRGNDWRSRTLLSLAGVYKTDSAVPAPLRRFLGEHPTVDTVHLHLDNDETGRGASKAIMRGLKERYAVLDEPNPHGKDINDELMFAKGLTQKGKEYERE